MKDFNGLPFRRRKKDEDPSVLAIQLSQLSQQISNGTGGSGGVLVYNTLTDLQNAFPNGSTQPAWVISDNEWYYWSGAVIDTTPPNEVTNLTISNVTSSTLTLSWTASTSIDIASYDIYQGSTLLGNTVNTTYNVSGLTQNTSYTFTVKAKDTSGNISTGTSVTQLTATATDTTAPDPVVNLSAGSPTSNSIVLTWTAPTATDVSNYEISYSTNSGSTYSTPIIISAPATSYTVTGLTASTTYMFKVVAIDGSGNRSTDVTAVSATSAASVSTYVNDTSLKVYYDFRPLVSTPATITDSSGNGNDGTLYGYAGTATSGINNGELVNDGSGDYITIPSNTTLKTYPFTIEFYSRFDYIDNTVGDANYHKPAQIRLFDAQYDSAGTGNGYNLFLSTDAYTTDTTLQNTIAISGSLGQPATLKSPQDASLWSNTYKHVVIVWEATQQKIYIDNTLVSSQTSNSTSPLGTRNFYLFTAANAISSGTLKGATKLFRFYNKALSASEVTQNYNEAIS